MNWSKSCSTLQCISPILVRQATRRDYVPCGACNYCLSNKRADWTFRVLNELKTASTAAFLTMTYSDEHIRYDETSGEQTLSKIDVQLFTKRLRKAQAKVSPERLRYYTVGEYGTETSRPHVHSIMFNVDPSLKNRLPSFWPHGHMDIDEVNHGSIHYVTKYVVNRVGDYEGRQKPFSLISNKPGLGSNYLTPEMLKWHQDEKRTYTQQLGQTQRLPRYYKDKIFPPAVRARLAAEGIILSDEAYHKELDRLRRFHPDPAAYIEESARYVHDHITEKINDKNKF